MPTLLGYFLITLALLSSAQGAYVNAAKELAGINRAVEAGEDFKELEKRYLALLEQARAPEEKLVITTAIFGMFGQKQGAYPDEIITYASALLALNPESDVAAKAHAFWSGALYKKGGQAEEVRAERAKHNISIAQIALKELGPIRKHADIPLPSNVSYINAVPSNADERKKYDDHHAKQMAGGKATIRLGSLCSYLHMAKAQLRHLYADDEPTLRSLVREQIPNEDEAAKVLAVIYAEDKRAERQRECPSI